MNRPIVIVSSPIDPAGFDLLAQSADARLVNHNTVSGDEFLTEMRKAEGVITRSLNVTAGLLAECPNLKVVAKHGAGVDTIDIAAATKLGIVVTNTGAGNASGVAEGALALVFATLRRLPEMHRIVTGGDFANDRDRLRFADLSGKTVGLVGFGNIGREFARMCAGGFGTKILAFDPGVSASDMERLDVRKCDTLPQMLPQVDVLSIHAPLVPSTRHIIAGREIALMKRSAILINTSRGGLVDEVALAAALNEGMIAGAGVDVFEVEPPPRDNPLFTARNIVLTPHISGGTDSAFVALAVGSATAVLDVLSGKKPRYLINPEVLGRTRAKLPA